MNRMDKVFGRLAEQGKKILVLYFPIGDTILDDDCLWAGRYFDNGCTVLEIGLPYHDPVLDGKTVKDSMQRALKNKSLDEIFAAIGKLRKQFPDNILQIMTYYEIIQAAGIQNFAKICGAIGIDGVLTPNIPLEKIPLLDQALGQYDIYNLRFSPFHLTDAVMEDLKKNAKGYIFQQAVDGGTGPRSTVSDQVGKNVALLKNAGIMVPVVAGFGISDASQVKETIAMGADGIVVGSATISHIIQGDGVSFIRSLYEATK